MMQCSNQPDFFSVRTIIKERRRLLVKRTIIGNPWPLQVYPLQSLSNVSDVILVDGIQKYSGIRKVIYKMSKVSTIMHLL